MPCHLENRWHHFWGACSPHLQGISSKKKPPQSQRWQVLWNIAVYHLTWHCISPEVKMIDERFVYRIMAMWWHDARWPWWSCLTANLNALWQRTFFFLWVEEFYYLYTSTHFHSVELFVVYTLQHDCFMLACPNVCSFKTVPTVLFSLHVFWLFCKWSKDLGHNV